MNEPINSSDFAPADPTDGRRVLEWQSKYEDPKAKKGINFEAWYLAIHLLLVPNLMIALWFLQWPNKFHIPTELYKPLLKYGLAWFSGTLGGTLFSLKWLYHTVARKLWHLDRRLWRLFTPHISGGLACCVIALMSSGMLRIFDPRATESHSLLVGVGFLVGYFSDSAVAKLAEIAETLFGTSHTKELGKDRPAISAKLSGSTADVKINVGDSTTSVSPPNDEVQIVP